MDLARTFVVVLGLSAGACSSLGSAGDSCQTPQDCELGLECYGAVCTSTVLTCGPGTEQKAGQSGSPSQTQFCLPETRRRCGRGTVEVNGVCLREEEVADAGP